MSDKPEEAANFDGTGKSELESRDWMTHVRVEAELSAGPSGRLKLDFVRGA